MSESFEYDIVEEEPVDASTRQLKHYESAKFEVTVPPEKYVVDLSKFTTDENNLTDEACSVGQLLVYFGDIFSNARVNFVEAEEEKKRVYSKLMLEVQEDLKEKQERATVEQLKAMVTVHPEYREAVSNELTAQRTALRAETWWRSAQKKAEVINMLGYRQNSEMKRSY